MRLPWSIPVLGLAALAVAQPATAQEGLRLGLSFGGTGFVGVVSEWRWSDRSAELQISTFTFRDVSVSIVGKQYFGASGLQPVVGAGLWLLVAGSPDGTGGAVVARFPFGGDLHVGGGHYTTFEMSVNRGLWVKRPDPTNDIPITRRLIPLPSVSYRFAPD